MESLELQVREGQAGGFVRGAPWAADVRDVVRALSVDPAHGLSAVDVAARLSGYGENRLKEARPRPAWRILADQLANLIVALLVAAALVSFFFGKGLQSVAILAAMAVNVLIGFFTELQATRSMEALRSLSMTRSRVLRGGQPQDIPAVQLVPGDVVLLEGGDVIGADLRLLKGSRLLAEEAALTGESLPVEKRVEPCPAQAPLAERHSMLYRGTALTQGSGTGVVVATGLATELGRISELTQAATGEETPLEKRLAGLGRTMVWVVLAVASVIGVKGRLLGLDLYLIIETSIALAVAAIPEGLPIVATLALARGMWRMAAQNAVMRRLSAVETLGSTSVVCTDKTGTLTENRMRVAVLESVGPGGLPRRFEAEGRALLGDGRPAGLDAYPPLERLMRIGLLCNKAHLDDGSGRGSLGDPMEVALQELGRELGLDRAQALMELPEVREDAFDSQRAMMATWHRHGDGLLVAVKGAPEAVLAASTDVLEDGGLKPLDSRIREAWLAANRQLAADGLRVLGAACRQAASTGEEPYAGLAFVGLFALMDPPRDGVAEAIAGIRQAGIEVVMITGDQALTAKNIGLALGLIDSPTAPVIRGADLSRPQDMDEAERAKVLATRIFSRVAPEQKLDLISLFQQSGAVVAMTGDGVNDAPALKKADIGVAMGIRGTDVAKEAADMVLADDRFETIVAAVRQGRIIFGNIRKFILYLLSGNAGGVAIVAIAILAGLPLPLLPLQILYLNMLSDVFPALALGIGKGDETVMGRPPRDPDEPLMTRGHWLAVAGYGAAIAVSTLAAFWVSLRALGLAEERAVTVAFLTLALGRMWHIFNMRDAEAGVLDNDVTRNPWVWAALGVCLAMLAAALAVPRLAAVLQVVRPTALEWQLVAVSSLAPLCLGQFFKVLRGAVRVA